MISRNLRLNSSFESQNPTTVGESMFSLLLSAACFKALTSNCPLWATKIQSDHSFSHDTNFFMAVSNVSACNSRSLKNNFPFLLVIWFTSFALADISLFGNMYV